MAVWHRRSPIGTGALLIAALAAFASARPVRAAPECAQAPARVEILAGLGPRGELILASGARAVLDGLQWPESEAADADARAWLLRHRGRSLTLVARGETDRWGRIHGDASVDGDVGADAGAGPAGSDATDLAGALVGAGLALVDAGERDTLCRPALLAVEAGARRAARGLWSVADSRSAEAGSAAGPDVRDGAGLRARLGLFVVARGTVYRVGERPRRTYLDFARRGEDGLTVTVSKRTWRRLQERGLTAANLRGRDLRVRGRLEAWRGPTLDIASADMIEVLDGERAPRR